MPRFHYRAVSPQGEISEDVIEAPDREAAIARLRQADRLPVEVTAQGEAAGATDRRGARREAEGSLRGLWTRRRPSRAATIRFTRELETLVGADLTVERALEVLRATTEDAALAQIVTAMRTRIRAGASLADAAAEHPDAFSAFYCAVLRAGEAGGRLPQALAMLARYLERSGQLVAAVQSALIYPTVLLLAALVSLVILLVFVVPQFALLFREAAAEIPAATRAVIALSRFTVEYGWLVLVALLAGWLAARLTWRRSPAALRLDALLLAMPLVGDAIRRIETERFARALGTLLGNGVSLPDALRLSAGVVSNRVIAGLILRGVDAVRQGERLATSLARGSGLPPLAVELIRVGEEGGRLSEMLARLAETNAAEAERAIKRLVAAIEPALIVVIGVAVGAVILSLVTAIVGINALAF